MNNIRSLLSYISKNKKIVGFFLILVIYISNTIHIKAQDTYINDCGLTMQEDNIYQDYGILNKEDILWAFNQLKSYCKGSDDSTLEKNYNAQIPGYVWIMDYLLLVGESKLLGTADKLGLENDPMGAIYKDRKEKNKINLTGAIPAKLMQEYNNIWLPLEKGDIIGLRYKGSSGLQSKFMSLCDHIYTIASRGNIWSRGGAIATNYATKRIDCKKHISSLLDKELNITDNIIESNKNNIQNTIALGINKYNNRSTYQMIQSLQNIINNYMDSVMKVKSAGEVNVCQASK